MTITREQLEKAAKATGIDVGWNNDLGRICLVEKRTKHGVLFNIENDWAPHEDKGQLLDLAMAHKIDIKPSENRIGYWRNRMYWVVDVNCQDFPALAEAVISACLRAV